MSRSAISVSILLTFIISLCYGVDESENSIRCYQCNSKIDPGCAVLPPLTPNSTSRYLKTCDADVDGQPPFCRKSIIKVLNANNGKGEERVVRACGWYKHKNECYQYDDDDHHELVCQCFTDACNAAPSTRHAPASAFFSAVFILSCSTIAFLACR